MRNRQARIQMLSAKAEIRSGKSRGDRRNRELTKEEREEFERQINAARKNKRSKLRRAMAFFVKDTPEYVSAPQIKPRTRRR